MKHETILDISITFKTCWTCLHDVFGTKAHVQRPLWKLFIRISWRQLPAGKKDTNFPCKPPWKRYQCRILDSITSSGPWKTKKRKYLNIAISKIIELPLWQWIWRVQYFANFTNLSEIRKFCTRNATLIWLTVKPIYIIFRSLVRTIWTCVRIPSIILI